MRTLPAEADVVVIGAGVSGASIGYQLARHSDRRVVVVDARPPVGGISGRTFGQIRQHYSNELMVRMAL
ncbi:MAG: FAD-binding oxidoreductase, partial [Acidimicrobiaceae bacterium]|nr:FAD-binding oxidoreductase [Acidimicrobiaceae bacterium]